MPNGDTESITFTHQGQQYSISGVPKGLQDAEVYEWARINKPKFAALNLPSPAAKQAHKEASAPISGLRESPLTAYSIFQPTGVSTQPKGGQLGGTAGQVEKVRKLQQTTTETVGSMVGGLGGAAIGTGVHPLATSAAGRVLGAGVGAAAGTAISEADQGAKTAFWDAAKTGALFSFFEAGGEALTAGFRAVSRLWSSSPEYKRMVAEAGDFLSTEERTRQVVQERAPKLREAANASYPALPDVPIMPAARTAQASEAAAMRTSVEGLPKQVGKLADIGRTRQREALSLLVRARRVMQAQGASPQVLQLLDQARQTGKMSAIDAQQVKSALGRLISKGNLPGPQYQAAKDAYEAIKGSIERVAADSGQLAAYQAAEGRVAQWHADFDNKGAPLEKLMDAKPDERGKVLEHLIADPETRVRATEALERNGFDTTEIKRLASKYRDPTDVRRAAQMTSRVEQMTEKVFAQQEAAATRKRVGAFALKKGIPYAIGGGYGLYELFKQLKSRAPNLLP